MSVIDDSESVSFEVEDFQVLDECVGEDDTPSDEDKPDESDSRKASADGEEIDLTAELDLDNLNDRDVMEHLNEIENIALDAKGFGLEPSDEDKPPQDEEEKVAEECPDIILLEPDKSDDPATSEVGDEEGKGEDEEEEEEEEEKKVEEQEEEVEVNPENQWYEEKLKAKVATVKDRLAKLSRVLELSYPCYKEYLQQQAEKHTTAVCKLEPPRRCPLDKPHTNRWKFKCTRKPLEESPDTAENNDENTVSKTVKIVWRLAETDLVSNANELQTNPTFVMHAVKIFEDFMNSPAANEEDKDVETTGDDKKEPSNDDKEVWLSLLVRSNSNDELMLFATGREIPQGRLEELRLIYENGVGKDCKVKSLYCKNTTKASGSHCTQTIFLSGVEALDETVGDLKIQLAPKTNFWSNKVGAEQLGKAVQDLVNPSLDTTVIEIGCGLGLLCLMLAPKCEEVIGLDSQSEIEEAEMTCEFNKIKNATFVTGESTEVMSQIAKTVNNRRTCAIINANSPIAQNIEVIWGLRRIPSLRRLVMVTTLTKPTIRPILELINPSTETLGRPFVPLRAIIVDTLPKGQHFEIAFLLERRPTAMLLHPKSKSELSDKNQEKNSQNSKSSGRSLAPSKGASLKHPQSSKRPYKSASDRNIVKNPFHDKSRSPPRPYHSKNPPPPRPSRSILPRKRSHNDCESFRISVPAKISRPSIIDPNDLRARLNHNRSEPDLAQQVREQQRILEIAKQKLTSSVDPGTARQLQDILNLALEQTNNMKSRLPRSVWDRIAPPEGSELHERMHNDAVLKGSFVEERGGQDIVITTPNAKYNNSRRFDTSRRSRSPNHSTGGYARDQRKEGRDRRDKPYDREDREDRGTRDKWNMKSTRRERSPRRLSPRRPSPRRGSPPRRHSPNRSEAFRRSARSPLRHISPRKNSPSRAMRRNTPPRCISPMAGNSPRRMSPPRRQLTPPRKQSPPRRKLTPPRRQLSPARREFELPQRRTLGSLGQNDRRSSPSRRQASPPRRQSSTVTPSFGDDWDIPSRGAVEQQSNWQRQNERQVERSSTVWSFAGQDGGRSTQTHEKVFATTAARKDDNWIGKQSLSDGRWSGGGAVSSDANWGNNRSKEGFSGQTGKVWMDVGKDDWNDLPEDARDPWDDGGTKERWVAPGRVETQNWGPGQSGQRYQGQGPPGGAPWAQRPGGISTAFLGRGFIGFNDGR